MSNIKSNNINKHIAKSGLKKTFIAEQIGVHRTDISNWISGNRKPNRERLRLLARILKCNMSDLYESGEFRTTYNIKKKELD
tara:strand:- start:214 stop:459 length:246 start_codon:yes stop_codon:yes gene_type:complete